MIETNIACFDISQLTEEHASLLYAQASPERQAKADGFRHPSDRLRCLAAEALVRYALGPDVALSQEEGGKPWALNRPGQHFNLSHSGSFVVIAWGSSPVGIDIEQIRPNIPWERLSRRYFSPQEQTFVAEADHIHRFFEIWTAKESYLKYLGTGLRTSLSKIDVLSLAHRHPIYLEGYSLTLFAQEPPAPVTFLAPKDII